MGGGGFAVMIAAVLVFATNGASSCSARELTGATPQGWTLALAGRVDFNEVLNAIPYPGMGQALRHVNDTSGSRTWFSFALENPDSLFWWPAGQAIQLVLRDGTVLRPVEQMAMTEVPSMSPVSIGGRSVKDTSGRLARKRFRSHGTATVIFAAFRLGIAMNEIAAVRVGSSADGAVKPAAPARWHARCC